METAGDGSIQPGLSVLLRGNATGTPFNRLSVDTTDTASGQSDVNRDTTGRIERGGSGGAAEAEGDIGRVRDGGAKMLDLVTEHPSGCTVNDRVISEPCNIRRSPSNGFTGSNQAERAGTDGTECHPVPGTGEMMNEPGKAFHALSLSEQIMDVSADEPCALNSRTMSHPVDPPALSPNGRHENSRFTGIAVPSRSDYDGLLNGEADTGAQSPPGADTGRASQSERHTEAKMSNGGLSPGHSDSPYRMSGVNTRASLSHLQNPPSSSPPSSSSSTAMGGLSQDSGRAIGERDRTEGNRSGTREENTVGENPSPGSGLITSRGSPLGPRGQATPSPAGAAASPDPATTRQAGDDGASDPGLSLEPSPGPSPRGDGDGEARSGTGGFSDVSLDSRNTYESSRRQSAPGHLPPGLDAADPSEPEPQSKRPGIAEYFGRSLFSKRQREHSAPGWKLFGKVPLRESPSRDSRTIQQESVPGSLTSVSTPDLLNPGEYEAKQAKPGNSPTHNAQGRSRRNLEFEPLSTTALILEDRPANLPAKSVEEAQRHRQEYEEMVAEARKRELREAQRKQRQMKERIRQEDSIASAMLVWNNDILPHWDSARNSRRARDLWWQGLPPNVRGRVWSLAIANELNITPELYEIFLSRAREKWRIFSETGSESEADDGASLADRESSLDLIKLDISRTFPSLFIFQKGGPYHDVLHSVLGAYTCYRPDVGYVQGMSFIAAVLILNLEEADAFIAFANLLNKPCQLAFFRVDHDLMLKYFAAFEVFFEENLPRLFNHFQSHNLTPDLYLIDWIFTLYSKSLALDVACRVWDVFCRDGEEFLFQTGLGILRLYEDVLLQMDFIHIAQFLTRLPDHVPSDRLFSCIAATPMVSGNRRWTQVFNALIKDNKENGKE